MKVAINTEHCVAGIQKASSITPSKTGSSLLRTMWIKTDQAAGTISFMSTDASTEFIGTYPAEVSSADELVGVNSKAITDLLRSLPAGIIHMEKEAESNNLVIRQGKRMYKLPTSVPEWCLEFSPFPNDETVTWSGEFLTDIIDKVLFCIADDEETALGCMIIKPKENGEIDFCGLDGNKFAQNVIVNDNLLSKLPEDGILIQKKYLSDIRKLISLDEIELGFTDKRLFIRSNGGQETVSIPLVQFVYPDYSVFLSRVHTDTNSKIEISKPESTSALSRIQIFNTKEDNCVYISIDEDSLTFKANDKGTGSAVETIPAIVNSSVKNVTFITKTLLEIFQHMSSDKLLVTIASDEGPCAFQSTDDHNYLVVAMPMLIVDSSYYEEVDE